MDLMTLCRYLLPFVLLWTVYAAVVDLRTRSIPGGLPRKLVLAATGTCAFLMQITYLPQHLDALIPMGLLFAMLFIGWLLRMIGGGDVRLWAIWWIWTPPNLAWIGALVSCSLWVVGALFQLLVLRLPRGQKHPAGWMAALYGLWLTVTLWVMP